MAELRARRSHGVIDRPSLCAHVLREKRGAYIREVSKLTAGCGGRWRSGGKKESEEKKGGKVWDRGKGKEITWRLERTAWGVDSLTPSRAWQLLNFSSLLKLLEFIRRNKKQRNKVFQELFYNEARHCQLKKTNAERLQIIKGRATTHPLMVIDCCVLIQMWPTRQTRVH